MLLRSKWNIVLGSLAILTAFALVDGISQPADAQTTLISFEQSEDASFVPTLIPDPAPLGVRDPDFYFIGFAGGPDTGYQDNLDPGNTTGPIADAPLNSSNGGAVVNWGVASFDPTPSTLSQEARNTGTWFIDDGPGGLDIQLGTVSTCIGAPASCAPSPVSGNQYAGFGGLMEGGQGYKYAGVMDLDNTQDFQIDSFWYANRGNGPPRLQVEYYATDDTTLLGVNTFAEGTDMRDDAGEPTVATWGDRWIGVAENFDPKFQQFTPTAQFQGVALGKVIFRSFSDGHRTEIPFFDNLWNGDVPSAHAPDGPGGHGVFFLDDILITAGGAAFNPNGYTRISFESDTNGPEAIGLCQDCAGGFPDADGALLGQVFNMSNGVVTSITNNAFANADLKINHGPGGQGTAAPGLNSAAGQYSDTEPDPVHGYQFLLSQAGANGNHSVTIDLENGPGYSFEGLWYANRGSAPPRVRIEYYDLNENLIGENSWSKPNEDTAISNGVGLGQFDGHRPEFQFLEVPDGSVFKGVAVSKITIISEAPNPASQSATFSVDDILLKAGGSAFVEPGDFRISFEASEGFSDTAGDTITGAVPAGIVSSWSSSGSGSAEWQIDEGQADGEGFPEDDDPVSGEQFGLSRPIGNGEHIVEMDLVNAANLALDSFFYAYRGSSPHDLTVEYFDLNEVSLGTDVYNGGVDPNDPDDGLSQPGFLPSFEKVTPTASFLNKALSKVIFTSAHTLGLGAAFALDDIVLSTVTFLDGDFNLDGTVDGLDFLEWQRTGGTPAELTDWQTNYGMTLPLAASSTAVPEPTSVTLLLLGLAVIGRRTRRPSVH